MQPDLFSISERFVTDDDVIAHALRILAGRIHTAEYQISSPQAVKNYLTLSLAQEQSERFVVLFLDTHFRVISKETMFTGSLTSCTVHPREVVKAALKHNAAAIILAHNHPSGEPKPSEADYLLTRKLTQALDLVDVRILDHIVVAGMKTYSFAEHGDM